MELVGDLTLVLVAALVGAFIAQRFKQPLIVGYILAGVVVGPFTGGLTVVNVHDIEQLAEIGVALLLFSLGLEVSFRELAPVRTVALAGATLQIVLTIALGLGIGLGFGWSWPAALWFGALISLSSTMVALKTVQTQGRLGTLSSRVMLGILVVQDLAVVPMMIVLPELSASGGGVIPVVTATVRAIVLLGVIVFVSTRIVPRLMAFVARWNSRELFLLSTTAAALGVGYVTWSFGLSLALGAFVAGLVINESEYAHQALSDVVPLRDVFGMLFFVSEGMLLDPAQVWQHLGTLAVVVIAVILGKSAILAVVVRVFGYRNVVPLAVGLTLFQVGEFAFVLGRVGQSRGAIPDDLYSLMLNTAIATMALTPAISGLTPAIYARVRSQRARETVEAINIPTAGLADHIIIAGSGRVGRSIADVLSQLRVPCVLIEFDDRRVRQAREAGFPVIYGDASQSIVLEAAAISRARAILVTAPAFPDVRSIVTTARYLQPDLAIIARADGREAVHALYALGIEEVTSPEFEAAIEMTRQALVHCHVPAHEILRVASAIRRERYDLAGGDPESGRELISQIGEVARQLDFTWVGIPPDSPFDGRSLAELRIRTAIGASIVGIIHAGTLISNPDSEVRLETGDLVAVLGTREQIARFESAARLGHSAVS
jgi:CPA2 family monovalent cation:H+ antiporter-2